MDLQEPWPSLRAWSAAILRMAAIRVSRAEVEEEGGGEEEEGRRAVFVEVVVLWVGMGVR